MALPELTRKKIEKVLNEYCEGRVPPHVRDKVRLNYSFRGNSVSLFEERPAFLKPEKWINCMVAQFRFDDSKKTWSLYCRDRNSKWHLYDLVKPSRTFERLLEAVEEDVTGIFWG